MIPTKCLHKIIDNADADGPSTCSNDIPNENEIMTVVHSALICRKQMSEQSGYKGLDVSKQLARSFVPEMLHLYLDVLMKGQEAVDDFFDNKCFGDTADNDSNDYGDSETVSDSDDDIGSEDEEEYADNVDINEGNWQLCLNFHSNFSNTKLYYYYCLCPQTIFEYVVLI